MSPRHWQTHNALQPSAQGSPSSHLWPPEIPLIPLWTTIHPGKGPQPLVALFNPAKGTPTLAANRRARSGLTHSQYDYSIEYWKTADRGNGDALSRLPMGNEANFDGRSGWQTPPQSALYTQCKPTTPANKHWTIGKIIQQGPGRLIVMRHVREGWSHTIESDGVRYYRKLADSLPPENGCLIMGTQIAIPDKLQSQVLKLIHLEHFGMQRMKQLARSVVYCPHIDDDIEHLCRTCTACAEHQNRPQKPANDQWMLPEKAWSRLHVDHVINFLCTNWLVLVDPHSKYPCIHPITAASTKATTDLLEEDFAYFGYPHIIATDNATTFLSDEFQAWCRERGITHLTGAPYHPAMNGLPSA